MADILDSANTPTDDAAQTPQGAVGPPPAPPTAGDPSLVTYEKDLEKAAGIADNLVIPAPSEPIQQENPSEPPPPPSPASPAGGLVEKPKHKTKGSRGVVVALTILFIFLTTSLVFVFVSQQQSLNDIRNRAAADPGDGGGGDLYANDPNNCGGVGRKCSNGYNCEKGACVPNPITDTCGRDHDTGAPVCCTVECDPSDVVCEPPNRKECKTGGKWCTIQAGGCVDEPHPPDENPPPPDENSPTPTSIIAQCTNIKIYKDGVVVNPGTLLSGDSVVIAVAGTNATKARIRINNGVWTETTTKNASGEYTLSYTLPAGVTNFTIESEIFGVGGVWK